MLLRPQAAWEAPLQHFLLVFLLFVGNKRSVSRGKNTRVIFFFEVFRTIAGSVSVAMCNDGVGLCHNPSGFVGFHGWFESNR